MQNRLEITINIPTPLWKSRLKAYSRTIHSILRVALTEVGIEGKKISVAVVLADDELVRSLNANYRGKDKPTNVLSFPDGHVEGKVKNLGDIILALETVAKEAKEQNKTFREHTAHLLVHGFLHLLGYDHTKEEEAEQMEALEIKILEQLGVANPYTERT